MHVTNEYVYQTGVSIDDVVSVSDAAIQNSNKRTGQKLSVRFAITDELLTLRELKTKHEKELKELKEKLENPQALLDLMTAQQRRRFESFELEKWKNEQQYEKKLQLAKAQLTEGMSACVCESVYIYHMCASVCAV